jgi:two-component system sensor histidine kinase QseC
VTSIRRVLLVSLIGIMSVVIVVAAGFSYRAGLQEAGEMFDAKLAHSSRVLMSVVDESLGELREHGPTEPIIVRVWHGEAEGVGDALAFPTGHAYETKLAFQVLEADGTLLLRSDSGPVHPLAPLKPGYANVVIDGQDWRTFSLLSPGGHWYQSGELSDIRREIAGEIAFGTMVPLLLALPLLALFVWLVVNWASRGLTQVSEEIAAREPNHLGAIQLDRVPQEIQGLVSAVNGLLQRLDATLLRERRFTADAAHELRTPVAALKVHAHNLRHARSDAEREESQQQLDAIVLRTERLVAQLLALSRVEPGAAAAVRKPVRLDVLAREHLQDYQRLAGEKNITLALHDTPVTLAGEEAALDALVRNLVDNALRYTPAGGRVQVGLSVQDGVAVLAVEDSGPGIAPEARARAFERFHRGLGSGVEGSGLGLSIVKQVVDLHAGSIMLDESPGLKGLRATVKLPVD